MKIIRPENNTPTKNMDKKKVISTYAWESTVTHTDLTIPNGNCIRVEEELIDDNTGKDQTIENLMDEIIKQKDDKIQVTISLTKRQYDLYLKKGGESWIKKVITGQKIAKKRK